MAIRVTGGGEAEMKALAVKLREADPKLKLELRRNMRAVAAPTVAHVRASILSMPSHHDGTLRGQIAKTVSASVGLSASRVALDVISSGRKMPAGKGELPKDTNAAGWWHPVYGRAEAEKIALASRRVFGPGSRRSGRGHGRRWTWTRQTGKPGWFEEPIAQAGREVQRAIQAAMDETARKLEH